MGIKYSSFAIRGIDVSAYNGNIDWSKVSANFAAIRVGYGRSVDNKFVSNWQNAKSRVRRIPYWYMDYYSNHNAGSAVNGLSDEEWGRTQAQNCWALLKDDPEGAVFLDIESGSSSYSPPIATVASRAQSIAKAFLQEMDVLNARTNGIYCSLGMLTWFSSWFKDRPLWVAWYNEAQTPATVLAAVKKNWLGKCLIWQYASDGDIDDNGSADGVSMGMQYSFLDLNAWLGTSEEYNSFFGQSAPITELYRVKILVYNLLVRSGPGQTYTRLRRADFPGEYSIYEEQNGYGRISASASEWISLNPEYTQKLDGSNPGGDVEETDPLYKVKILIYNLLVRTGPGKTYPYLRRANFPGEYNIYEEQNGYGRISAAESEWISLNTQYVQRLDSDNTPEEEPEQPTSLYAVKILIYNLSVRTGPGILYRFLRRANFPGEYNIYEEKNNYGRISQTKSEWINLSTKYVQRLDSKHVLSDQEKLDRLWATHPELH